MGKAYFTIVNGDSRQFAVFPEEYRPDGADLTMSVAHRIDTAVKDTSLHVVIVATVKQEDRLLLKMDCMLEFKFTEESFKEFRKEDVYEVPTDILQHFGALTYGALRGALIARKSEIAFPMPVLPAFDITRLINEPLLISK